MSAELDTYLREIEEAPLLKAEREKELARKGDDISKKELVRGNLRLVVKIAQLYEDKDSKVSIIDLIEEGNIGLYKAVDMYVKHSHYEKDYKFSTYATWWIRRAIMAKLGTKEV